MHPHRTRSFAFLLTTSVAAIAIAIAAAPLACSSTEVVTRAAADPDAEAPVDPDSGAAGSTPDGGGSTADAAKHGTGTRTEYQACSSSSPCIDGLDCVISSVDGQGGVCQQPCHTDTDCDGLKCDRWCRPYCMTNVNCPKTLRCESISCDAINCTNVPFACSASEMCNAYGACVPKDTPPVACTKTTTTGLPESATLGGLVGAQRGTLCDWSTCQLGGYGAKTVCDGGISVSEPANQAACVAKLPTTCAATVAQYEACITAQAANPCDLSITLSSPVCAPVAACLH